MGWAIWWPMQENSESKIGQQDRKDHVVQTPKKLLRERARLHVNMLGTVSHLFIRWVCCYTISLELDTDELVIKVMRKDKGCKTKESDLNKLFIDNVSGD